MIAASVARAAARASSAVTVMKAFSFGSSRSIRARVASVTSTGDSSRAASRGASSAMPAKARS
jgi:hypothetical protein